MVLGARHQQGLLKPAVPHMSCGASGLKSELTACKPGNVMYDVMEGDIILKSLVPRSVAKTLHCDSLPPSLVKNFGHSGSDGTFTT
jgi:hypothetical protein